MAYKMDHQPYTHQIVKVNSSRRLHFQEKPTQFPEKKKNQNEHFGIIP